MKIKIKPSFIMIYYSIFLGLPCLSIGGVMLFKSEYQRKNTCKR